MKITRKRKKKKKPGEEDGNEARMQNRARAREKSSMTAWFATMVIMLLALANASVVVDGFVVSNVHRLHGTIENENGTHDVLAAMSSEGGAIGIDDGEVICDDNDCKLTTTNTLLDEDEDEASVNYSDENYKSTARELVAGRVSVDTDATITRSVEKNENDGRCVMSSREDIFMSADMVDYTIADWVLDTDRESGSTSLVKAQFAIDLSGMFEAKDGSSGIEATLCCSRQLNLNILRNGWRITRGDSAGIIREDGCEFVVNASDDDQRFIGKVYHDVSFNVFGRAHDLDCWEVKRIDLAICIEQAWAEIFVISKVLEESSRDVIECGKAVEYILETDNIEQGRVSIVARHDDEISVYGNDSSLDVTITRQCDRAVQSRSEVDIIISRASESDRGRDAILGNERLETDGYINSRAVESSRDKAVGRERYGSEANTVMNSRILYESDSLEDDMACDHNHENVKQGRVSVIARHSHMDRSVSWMLRCHDGSDAGRVNRSLRVEYCAAGIDIACSVDTERNGVVSSIEVEGDDISYRCVDTFAVRSYDGLRLNDSLDSYTTVGSGGSVIVGRLNAVDDASPSDDTMRLHVGSLVNKVVKRMNSDEVEDTVGYRMKVEDDGRLIYLIWSIKSLGIVNELNDIDMTSEKTAESAETISLKSEHKICSNCADEVSGASVDWNRNVLGTILEVEYIMCIPLNVSNDIDDDESTERSADSGSSLDYMSSCTDGKLDGKIVGAEMNMWKDESMKRACMEYDCRFAILHDGKRQYVTGIRSAECGHICDEMYTVEQDMVVDTDTNFCRRSERSVCVILEVVMVLLIVTTRVCCGYDTSYLVYRRSVL